MLYKQRNYRGLCKRIVIFRVFRIVGQMTSYACLSCESRFLHGDLDMNWLSLNICDFVPCVIP
jgi:hypothetical protein